jgi:hypothetical protein
MTLDTLLIYEVVYLVWLLAATLAVWRHPGA